MCKEQIALHHYLVVRQRKFSRFWIPSEYVNTKDAWDYLTNSFGRTETILHHIVNDLFVNYWILRCGSLLELLRWYEWDIIHWLILCLIWYAHAANASFIFIDSASWIWGSHPLSCNLTQDEQESKLGEVDEFIFKHVYVMILHM